MRRGNISSELLMCGGGVHSIFLLPLVTRLLDTIDVCICIFMSVVVIMWGFVGMFVEDSVSSLGVLKYFVCLCR